MEIYIKMGRTNHFYNHIKNEVNYEAKWLLLLSFL